MDLGGGEELSLGGENLSSFLSQNLSELRQSMKAHQATRRHNIDVAGAEAKCLVRVMIFANCTRILFL